MEIIKILFTVSLIFPFYSSIAQDKAAYQDCLEPEFIKCLRNFEADLLKKSILKDENSFHEFYQKFSRREDVMITIDYQNRCGFDFIEFSSFDRMF